MQQAPAKFGEPTELVPRAHKVVSPLASLCLMSLPTVPSPRVFVVPPLGGIEAATKPQVPVKTGATNDERRDTPKRYFVSCSSLYCKKRLLSMIRKR